MTGLAPYDVAVPHPPPDPALAARFAAVRARRPAADVGQVRDVVLVASSSRGGSSMLAELLRGQPGLLSTPAEVNPYVVVAQLAGADADRGGDLVLAELAAEVGAPDLQVDSRTFADFVTWRLLAQWPDLHMDPDDVGQVAAAALESVGTGDTDVLTATVLHGLRALYPRLRPDRYDLPEDLVEESDAVVRGPSHEPVVEMTPFVGFRPWRLASDEELRSRPLVIATPRNSFRLAWWQQLFPRARVRVVHLIRNPAAAVNGLVDGWRHDGFYTCRIDAPLSIAGYSDAFPWGRSWWKYDVPPGWRAVVNASLAEVAALQWCEPHEAVLAHEQEGGDVLRVRYEDLVGPRDARDEAATRLAQWLGTDAERMRATVRAGVAPVMATAPPRRRRWDATDNDLSPALAEPRVWDLTTRLGYDVEERLWI